MADLSRQVVDEGIRASESASRAMTLSAAPVAEGLRIAQTLSASRTLSAAPAELSRVKDQILGVGRTTGVGTPQMAAILEGSVRASDAASATISVPSIGLRVAVLVDLELAGAGLGWTNVGQYGDQDVVASEGVVIRRGIFGSGPNDNTAGAGTASFTLNNSAANSAERLGYYSLYHANRRAGWGVDIGCRIRLVDPATLTSWTRFVGKIDSIAPAPGRNASRYVRVTATDWLDDAARWTLTPDIGEQVNKRWDEILIAILAHMPTAPPASGAQPGGEAYPYALDSSSFSNQTALGEFKKLADSERGFIYQKADGTFIGEARHARLSNLTSVWSLSDGDLLTPSGLSMPSTRDEIIDTVISTIHPKIVDPLPTTVVYDQANVIAIQPGIPQLLLGSFRDPITGDTMGATAIQPLVRNTDWMANSQADGLGTDVSASWTVAMTKGPNGLSFTVTNGGATVGYLTQLAVRGEGIRDKATLQLQYPAVAGQHVATVDMPYNASVDAGQGAAVFYQRKYSTAFAQARTATVPGKRADLVTGILQREISHRITIAEEVTGLANDSFINGIEERVLPSGHIQATYTLAPAQDPFAALYWVIGKSVLGTDTVLAPF